MPPVPKRKISSRRQGKRRAAKRIKIPNLVPCPSCGQLKKPHFVCPNCQNYQHKNEKSQ